MYCRDNNGVYHSRLLAAQPWLDHGFGTRAADPPRSAITLKQIHSDRILRVGDRLHSCEGDALITSHPGTFVAVKTADCVPILIADPESHAVAAVHAGWRGTVLGIAVKTLRRLEAEFRADAGKLLIAIGPCIGGCCYEVGPEVAQQFQELLPERDDLDARTRLDLAEVNLRQLCEAGVRPDHISIARRCTLCGGEEFHSFRRDRERAGRMLSVIGLPA